MENLNTSHVNVNLLVQQVVLNGLTDLNTSHVNVNHNISQLISQKA